jgi:hypothetical protein
MFDKIVPWPFVVLYFEKGEEKFLLAENTIYGKLLACKGE